MKKIFGFTLLEMLVVIGIIAVLVGFGAVSYSTTQKKARDAKRELDIDSIKNAMEQYYSLCNGAYPIADYGKVPVTIEALIADGCNSDTMISSSLPLDPKIGDRYDYNDSDPSIPFSICATTDNGTTNLMEAETSTYCVNLQQ